MKSCWNKEVGRRKGGVSHSVSRSPLHGPIPTMASCQLDKWPHLASPLTLNSIIPEAYNNLITLFPPTEIQVPTAEEEVASDAGFGQKASRRVRLKEKRGETEESAN